MNLLFTKIRDKHSLWYKVIVFIVAVSVSVYLLPKNSSYYLNTLQVNDVWTKENVVSNLDFLVRKSDKKTTKEVTPLKYYQKQSIDALIITKYIADNSERKNIRILLDSIYKIGVYDKQTTDSELYIISENEVVKTNINQLYSVEKLHQLLKSKYSEIYPFLKDNLPVNLIFDEPTTQQLQQDATKEDKAIYKLKVKQGETILRKNETISTEKLELLLSYKTELNEVYSKSHHYLSLLGFTIICSVLLGIMMLFLVFFRKNIFSQSAHVTFLFLVMMLILILVSLVNRYNIKYNYAVPFCLIPVIIRVFFDSRTALFSFLIVVLLSSFFCIDKFEFVFIQLASGIGVIFSVDDMSKRSRLFVTALLAFIFYVITFVAYHLANNTLIEIQNPTTYICLLISSSCMLFAFPLIFLFEKLFGFVSDFTLLELCDLNQPLLRLLSQKIPGTFQHSLQVANLAEEACYKIGGNALLVRTGAMYHDIGKMKNPRYFTENQVGEVSPHADMSSEESAKIIINHVISGVEIAKENNLPESVIDFIRTHHGTSATQFFLHNYKKEHSGEIINEDLFRYPGPIPFSKETAILMMADSVEASSRSLKKYDAVVIDELVDKILDRQINENQFLNADITFKEINQIKKIFKKRLMNIYHVRIEYPR